MIRVVIITIILSIYAGYAIEYQAILVGIEDYKYVNDLRYCVDDVEDMNLALQTFPHWNSANITILTNEHATKAAIKAKLQEMEKLCPEDVFIFHFSGHGDKDNSHCYLCPYETELNNYATMIKDEDFQNWMNKIAARKIIIIDACHSGGMAYGGMVPRGLSDLPVEFVPASGGFQEMLGSISNTVALLACKADEYSIESSFLLNGVFSYYLIEALNKKVDNNGNYHTSAEEIFAYASPKTEEFVKEHYPGAEQHPQMRDNFEGELPVDYIFVVCSAEGSINITPALMDINKDGKQEIFLACDDGDDDGYGMAYAFDSNWNLMWSKDVIGDFGINPPALFLSDTLKIEEKRPKFGIDVGLEKIYFFSPYDSLESLWELPKGGILFGTEFGYLLTKSFFTSIGVTYAHRLPLKYYGFHPTDRIWFLRFVLINGNLANKIYYPFGLPITSYFGLGIDFCKASNVSDFLEASYLIRSLPLTLGIRSFGRVSYVVRFPFTVNVEFGCQRLIVNGDEKEIYNLSGLSLGIKVGYWWK